MLLCWYPSPECSSLQLFMANCPSSFTFLHKSPFREVHPDHLSQAPALTASVIPLRYSSTFGQDTYSFLKYYTVYFLHLPFTV